MAHSKQSLKYKSEFIWAEYFALYLCSQADSVDLLEAFTLGYRYVVMLPNLINIDPYEVVDEYLRGSGNITGRIV